MKKRIPAVLIALCLVAAFMPTVSRAAVTPYFMAINDTLLPFNDSTMPFVSGGEIFVPDKIFEGVNLFSIGSDSLEFVRLYGGTARYVDFYTARGVTEDQDGNVLPWPSAKRVGRRFYLPLRQVCDYFGFNYEINEVTRDIIPEQQMYVVRIISSALLNGPTFVGINRNAIRTAYNEYYAPPPPTPSPTPTSRPPAPPQIVAPPPRYDSVTIHLSFFDISAGSAGSILDLLDIQEESGYHSCFFVTGEDIAGDPGLIRRISGSGHMIGIWLREGTFAEYLETSVILFEAAKIRTVIVSADEAVERAVATANENRLVFWESAHSMVDYDEQSVTLITDSIPREDGARMNLLFSCSEGAASVLPGVYSYLRANEFTVSKITETVEPITWAETVDE